MKKDIEVIDKEKHILRVTSVDERWYVKEGRDEATGIPRFDFVPSVTWIADHYPKGVGFYKWLANQGWDEAEAIKNAAGDKGSKVHKAVQALIEGKTINIDSKLVNPNTEKEEELSLEEYDCLLAFALWHKENSPEFLKWEFCVWGDGYAGTVDLFCSIKGEPWLIDFKTSQYVWPSMELQVSAYKRAGDFPPETKLAILQLGYRMNKKRFKFTEVEEQYQEFLAAKLIWAKEQKGVEPKQRDYPLSVKLSGPNATEAQNARHKPVKQILEARGV